MIVSPKHAALDLTWYPTINIEGRLIFIPQWNIIKINPWEDELKLDKAASLSLALAFYPSLSIPLSVPPSPQSFLPFVPAQAPCSDCSLSGKCDGSFSRTH